MRWNLRIYIGLLWVLLSSCVWAKEMVQLKNLELCPIYQNKIQIVLEFTGPVMTPKSFSVETPSTIVFDFPSVKNKLSKELLNQKKTDGVLKGINVVETEHKTRMILDVRRMVPFETEVEGNIVKITLYEGKIRHNCKNQKSQFNDKYQIKSFDFRRGDRGEARIVINLATPDIPIDLKEENGKVIAEFSNATIEERFIKRYDVADFGTPVKTIDIARKENDIDLIVQTVGDYEKIAYQMDNQFIIEIRNKSEEEKAALKDATGQYVGGKISLNFQDIELRAVLQIIADFSGFNIIASDSVKGNITLRLQDIPWDQALDIILKSEGLDRRQYGNVMLVGPASEIAAREKVELEGQKQIRDLGPMKSELIAIKYANADDLAGLLKEKSNSLMTARGTVNVDKRTNTLLVQDIASKLTEIHALINKLDVPVRQVEISTQLVTADSTLESTLGMRFGGGANAGFGHRRLGVGSSVDRARAIADFTNGSGQSGVPPSNVNFAGAAPPNANITQQVFNVVPGPTVNNSEGLFSDLGAKTSANIPSTALAKVGLALAKLPNGTLLDLELQALEFESKSRTIARPKIVTMDQNKATVEKGFDIPYEEASSSGATSIAYKTAALKLEVTPHITPDDKIALDLYISNDSPAELPNSPGAVPISTNRLETKVLADNGETIVLGGILSITDSKQWSKVPFFGDLPIIGGLFRNKYAKHSPQELIIFLTPRIINPLVSEGG